MPSPFKKSDSPDVSVEVMDVSEPKEVVRKSVLRSTGGNQDRAKLARTDLPPATPGRSRSPVGGARASGTDGKIESETSLVKELFPQGGGGVASGSGENVDGISNEEKGRYLFKSRRK